MISKILARNITSLARTSAPRARPQVTTATAAMKTLLRSPAPAGDVSVRQLSVRPAAKAAVCYEDMIKTTLKQMIDNRDAAADAGEVQQKTVSDEDLERSFQKFETVFEEAELCMSDLVVATNEERLEEGECAQRAVDNVFDAYLDFVQDFRAASEEQVEPYVKPSSAYAVKLKQLRKDLSQILEG